MNRCWIWNRWVNSWGLRGSSAEICYMLIDEGWWGWSWIPNDCCVLFSFCLYWSSLVEVGNFKFCCSSTRFKFVSGVCLVTCKLFFVWHYVHKSKVNVQGSTIFLNKKYISLNMLQFCINNPKWTWVCFLLRSRNPLCVTTTVQ